MAKIPVKTVTFIGSKAIDQLKKNPHLVQPAVDTINKVIEWQKNRPVPPTEQRFKVYTSEILPNLDHFHRGELIGYKLDIKKILEQINADKTKDGKQKAALPNKKNKKWERALSQIEGKLNAKDYEEYLKLYHNPESESVYFQSYEQNIAIFKKLLAEGDSDKIRYFLSNQTNMDTQDINRDFFLEFS